MTINVRHDVFIHALDEVAEIKRELAAIKSAVSQLVTQGALTMASVNDLVKNLDDIQSLVGDILTVIAQGDAEKAALRQQIADLIAAAGIAQSEKDALTASIDAAWQKSEDAENALRAVVPGVPPVATPPLAVSHATRADFDAAVAAYQGPEAVTLDGSEVRAGTAPAIDFYSHSVDGSVTTSGPTD